MAVTTVSEGQESDIRSPRCGRRHVFHAPRIVIDGIRSDNLGHPSFNRPSREQRCQLRFHLYVFDHYTTRMPHDDVTSRGHVLWAGEALSTMVVHNTQSLGQVVHRADRLDHPVRGRSIRNADQNEISDDRSLPAPVRQTDRPIAGQRFEQGKRSIDIVHDEPG